MLKASAGGGSVAEDRFQAFKEQNLVTLIAVGGKRKLEITQFSNLRCPGRE